MSKFEEMVLGLIEQQPGLTDRQITDQLKGKSEGQQYVNQTCHLLEIRGQLVRRKRDDGLIGNYPAHPATSQPPQTGEKKQQTSKYDPARQKTVEPSPQREPDRRSEILLAAGFEPIGKWVTQREGIKLVGEVPRSAGVYAFVLASDVVYVGVASQSLRQRLAGYERPGTSQRTNQRVQVLIRAEIEAGKSVEVLVASPGKTEWNGLPVDLAPGLEAGLVRCLKPPWNKQGV